MKNNSLILNINDNMPYWVTIQEAVRIVNNQKVIVITEGDIYRDALSGKVNLSVYFQSAVLLRKIKAAGHKPKLHTIDNTIPNRLCLLEKNCFMNGRNLIISTEGKYFCPGQRIIDTTLLGYEYVLVQRLLASTLNLPLPVTNSDTINYGFSVTMPEGVFQLFEKLTWHERLRKQIEKFPESFTLDIIDILSSIKTHQPYQDGYFPLHDFPPDACFVIRYSELEKLISLYTKNKTSSSSSSTRISTPLSRLFWLGCVP